MGVSKHVIRPFWQIRHSEKEFSDWWKSKNKATIFFDGASKGNPWIVGAGGLIFSSGGKLEISFSRRIGQNLWKF